MKGISIREFHPDDIEKVWKLHIDGLNQTGTFVKHPIFDSDLDNIQKIYFDNNGIFLIVEFENKIIGMGALRKISDKTVEIKRIRIEKKFQRKGIGKLILEKLIKIAKELGYERLELDTSINQIPAQKLYESFGFREFKRAPLLGTESIFYYLNI